MNENHDSAQVNGAAVKEKKYHKIWIIVASIIVLAAAAMLLLKFYGIWPKPSADNFYDPSAVTGILPGMAKSEIQAELNRVVEEGMLNISINTTIYFTNGSSAGKADIVNVEANHYDFTVSITVDETGETVYESGGIRPGQYIQYITLSEPLENGEYDATATFTAYTDGGQLVGTAAAKIKIKVGTTGNLGS